MTSRRWRLRRRLGFFITGAGLASVIGQTFQQGLR